MGVGSRTDAAVGALTLAMRSGGAGQVVQTAEPLTSDYDQPIPGHDAL